MPRSETHTDDNLQILKKERARTATIAADLAFFRSSPQAHATILLIEKQQQQQQGDDDEGMNRCQQEHKLQKTSDLPEEEKNKVTIAFVHGQDKNQILQLQKHDKEYGRKEWCPSYFHSLYFTYQPQVCRIYHRFKTIHSATQSLLTFYYLKFLRY